MLHDICTMIFHRAFFITQGVENMAAKPQKIRNKDGSISYRMFISNNGKRESKTFSTSRLAIDWADKRLKEIERAKVYGEKATLLIREVITDYQERFKQNFYRSKNTSLEKIKTYPIADVSVDKLTPKDIIEHCTQRNKEAKPQTVKNDVVWLRTILRSMSAIDGFDYDPGIFERAMVVLKQEKLIARSDSRTRLPTYREMLKLTRYFRRKKSRTTIPMVDIIWFAYFSARRQAEITRLEWADNNPEKQTGMVRDAKHPRDKKGNHKRFKYEKSAWKIVLRQPVTGPLIFPYNPKTVGTVFERACKILGIKDLHFHDLRHAGVSRLFKMGYAIEQVQQFSLHEDWRTLAVYTHIKPEDIIDR
jgi:integrase